MPLSLWTTCHILVINRCSSDGDGRRKTWAFFFLCQCATTALSVVWEVLEHLPVHRLDYRRMVDDAMLGIIKEGSVDKLELELSLNRLALIKYRMKRVFQCERSSGNKIMTCGYPSVYLSSPRETQES